MLNVNYKNVHRLMTKTIQIVYASKNAVPRKVRKDSHRHASILHFEAILEISKLFDFIALCVSSSDLWRSSVGPLTRYQSL